MSRVKVTSPNDPLCAAAGADITRAKPAIGTSGASLITSSVESIPEPTPTFR
jgi:hypothetical protein